MDFLLGIALHNNLESDNYGGYAAQAAYVRAVESEFDATFGVEQGRWRIDGQELVDKTQAATVEVGYTINNFRISIGYWRPWSVVAPAAIVDEMAFTYLVNTHAVGGNKSIPLDQTPWGDYVGCATQAVVNCYGSSFELGGGFTAGLEYLVPVGDFNFGVKYRYLRPESSIQLWRDGTVADPVDMGGLGWWRESGFVNMDTISISVEYEL